MGHLLHDPEMPNIKMYVLHHIGLGHFDVIPEKQVYSYKTRIVHGFILKRMTFQPAG